MSPSSIRAHESWKNILHVLCQILCPRLTHHISPTQKPPRPWSPGKESGSSCLGLYLAPPHHHPHHHPPLHSPRGEKHRPVFLLLLTCALGAAESVSNVWAGNLQLIGSALQAPPRFQIPSQGVRSPGCVIPKGLPPTCPDPHLPVWCTDDYTGFPPSVSHPSHRSSFSDHLLRVRPLLWALGRWI